MTRAATAVRFHISDTQAKERIRELSKRYRLTQSYVAQALVQASLHNISFNAYLKSDKATKEILHLCSIGKGGKTNFKFKNHEFLFRDCVTLHDLFELMGTHSLTTTQRFIHNLLKLQKYPYSFTIFQQSFKYLVDHKMILSNSYKIDEDSRHSPSNTEYTYTISNLGIELVNRIVDEKYLIAHAF